MLSKLELVLVLFFCARKIFLVPMFTSSSSSSSWYFTTSCNMRFFFCIEPEHRFAFTLKPIFLCQPILARPSQSVSHGFRHLLLPILGPVTLVSPRTRHPPIQSCAHRIPEATKFQSARMPCLWGRFSSIATNNIVDSMEQVADVDTHHIPNCSANRTGRKHLQVETSHSMAPIFSREPLDAWRWKVRSQRKAVPLCTYGWDTTWNLQGGDWLSLR